MLKLIDRIKIAEPDSARRALSGIAGALAAILIALFLCPIYVHAYYYGVDEDYLLRTTKPAGRGRGHYLEFVSPDVERCTVQEGDTLWGIARKYYGSGAEYRRLWLENRDVLDAPGCLRAGTELKLSERLYTGVGMRDYSYDEVLHVTTHADCAAWNWKEKGACYQMFQTVTYRNDLGEDDPYSHWEEFKREAETCSRNVCGDRVSDLSFARYRVTDLCDMCYYQFVFDGGSKKYLIMAAFAYTDERRSEEFVVYNGLGDVIPDGCENLKSETFTVCDLGRCSGEDLREAKGKTFYEVARCIDTGLYSPKGEDYVGAGDWKYGQLHNPFTQAMRSLCDDPLELVPDYPGDYEITWEEPVFEKLVREELARLWQLTDEETKAFMARPVMASDLAGIDSLYLYMNQQYAGFEEVALMLNSHRERWEKMPDWDRCAREDYAFFRTFDDLANFQELVRLDITLQGSDMTDFSAVGEITGLRELNLEADNMRSRIENADLAFLGKLTGLRRLSLGGSDRDAIYDPRYYDEITDLSVLENCPRLTYVWLSVKYVESYGFLGELPEIRFFLLGGKHNTESERPDLAHLPNASYVECYQEVIYWDCEGRRRK